MQTHLAQSGPISEGKYRPWYTITPILYLHNPNRQQEEKTSNIY